MIPFKIKLYLCKVYEKDNVINVLESPCRLAQKKWHYCRCYKKKMAIAIFDLLTWFTVEFTGKRYGKRNFIWEKKPDAHWNNVHFHMLNRRIDS